MPFAACPTCDQQNYLKAESARTLKCVRCGQVFWVKAARPPSTALAAAARARDALQRRRGPAAAH